MIPTRLLLKKLNKKLKADTFGYLLFVDLDDFLIYTIKVTDFEVIV